MIKLRELEKRDMQIINAWRNDSDLIAYLGAPFRFINPVVDEKWFEAYMSNRNTQVRCVIVNDNDDVLGLVSLVNIDNLKQSAVFNIMIGDKDNRGKGVGKFATKEMLKHAFLNLNLNRIELAVLTDNQRAIKLYEKIGFVKEGIKRQSNYKNGKFVDMYMYSILKEEFWVKFETNNLNFLIK